MGVLHDAFLANVRSRMDFLGWNQSQLARELGMSSTVVSSYLRGRSTPGLALVTKFAVALRCGDPADLLNPDGCPLGQVSAPEPEDAEPSLEEQFHQLIEAELKQRAWSRSDLARAMGVGRQVVTQYLNGARTPGAEMIDRFFAALGYAPVLSWKPKLASKAPPSVSTNPRSEVESEACT